MSRSDSSAAAALVGNFAALILLILALAYLLDVAWAWLGGAAFAVCAVIDVVDLVLGKTVGMIMTCIGVIVFGLSGFKNGAFLALAVGGIIIGILPEYAAGALGLGCALVP